MDYTPFPSHMPRTEAPSHRHLNAIPATVPPPIHDDEASDRWQRRRAERRRTIRRRGRRIAPSPGFHLPRVRIYSALRGPTHCRR